MLDTTAPFTINFGFVAINESGVAVAWHVSGAVLRQFYVDRPTMKIVGIGLDNGRTF